jgi:hypothetical protein
MDQLPDIDPLVVSDVPLGRPVPDGTRSAVDRRLERLSRMMLRVGAGLVAVLVFVPTLGVAALLVYAATMTTVAEYRVTDEIRLQFLSVALLAVGFVVACAVALRRSLRRGLIALTAVAVGGLACMYGGVRGIGEATNDQLIALSWVAAATGFVLVLGASLGMAARVRASHYRAVDLRHSRGAGGAGHQGV